MAETGILYRLLIASSLLSVSNADVEPINFCSDSNEPQVLNAIYYGVITHNGNTDKWCNISLDGSDYIYTNNPYLAIANIVNSTECPSNENIYVNGKKFCIRESVTSLEVFPLNISTSVNISIPQEAGPFTLHYYNAILLCPSHPRIEDKITADGDGKLPKLYISNGYVSFANHFPKDTCFLDLINKEVGDVSIELVWPNLQTSTNISNFFTWSHCPLPSQGYTPISTDKNLFQLNFTQWKQNSTDNIFFRVSTPCPAPESVSNGAFYSLKSRHQYIPGRELDYICKKGFSKASEVLVCQHNGSWSPTPPCTVQALCPAPESVGNGTVYSPKSVQQYILGDELYYICDKGFSKVSVVMVCQRNGSWSPTPPCTVQATCPHPAPFANGTVCLANSAAQHLPGDELCYSCHDGFKKALEKTSCQNNGSWSPSPSCTALEESETMDNGQLGFIVFTVICGVFFLALCGYCINKRVRTKGQKCKGATPRQSDDTSTNADSSSTGRELELQDVIVNGQSRSTSTNDDPRRTRVEQSEGGIELQDNLVNEQQQDQLGNDTTPNGN